MAIISSNTAALGPPAVRAVHNVSGDSWVTSMGSAWISYFLWTEPYLLVGAQQAAAEQAAAQRAAAELAAARQAAAQAQTRDVDLEAVADLLDDEDDEDQNVGYGQIMVSMTRNPLRERS